MWYWVIKSLHSGPITNCISDEFIYNSHWKINNTVPYSRLFWGLNDTSAECLENGFTV
jgi:hypothetical protein